MNEENNNLNEQLQPSVEPKSEKAAKPKPNYLKFGIIVGAISVALILTVILAIVFSGSIGGGNNKKDDDDETGGETAGGRYDPERDDFINGLGGVSETFEGVVSHYSYSSADSAAEAFVVEELSGEGYATVHSIESKGELNDREIEKLKLPSDVIEGCDAVEKVVVSYSVETAEAYSRSAKATSTGNSGKTVTVYVIKYGVDWKYFSPMPVTGDTISKSYYDSVFNYEQYKNCTLEQTTTVYVSASAQGESYTMTMQIYQYIKHADNKVYLEQTYNLSGSGASEENKLYAYMEEVGGRIYCYAKMGDNSSWQKVNIQSIGFSRLEELTPFYKQYLDYTYFTKTEYGFALADENARRYFTQALASAFEGLGVSADLDNSDINMYAEYYVSEGVLSGMRVDADVDMSMNVDGMTGTINERVTSVAKCTDYGTTVVEKPDMN